MALRTIIFRPDTCGCTLEQTWEDSTSPWTFVSGRIVIADAAHVNSTYEQVLLENQLKNFAISSLLTVMANNNLTEDDIRWRFDESRRVIITISSNVTNQQRNAVRNELKRILQQANITASDLQIDKVVIESA